MIATTYPSCNDDCSTCTQTCMGPVRVVYINSTSDGSTFTEFEQYDSNEYVAPVFDEKSFEKEMKKEAAQWILREGRFFQFGPPELMAVTVAVMRLKMLRCNRKGIGLRVKEK